MRAFFSVFVLFSRFWAVFGVENLIPDRIDTFKVEKSQARLYDEQTLTYGELTTVDSEGNKKAFFYVLSSLELEMYERHREENSDVQISKGKIAEEKRYFRTAFF